MKKVQYKHLGEEILGYPAVSLPEVDPKKVDKMLSGKYGWIVSNNNEDTSFRAYMVQGYKGYKTEKYYPFNINDLKAWISRISLFIGPTKQEYYANNPNERLVYAKNDVPKIKCVGDR